MSLALKHFFICLREVQGRVYRSLRIITCLLAILISACGTQPVVKETTQPIAKEVVDTPLTLGDSATLENALSLMREQKWDQAIKPLRKLTKKYPGNLVIIINLASSYYATGDLNSAEELCKQALSISSNSAEAHNLSGLIAIEKHQFTEAEAAYKKALSINTDYANAYYNLALLYDVFFQDIPKAYQHYVKYLKLAPGDQATKDWVEQLKYSLDQN